MSNAINKLNLPWDQARVLRQVRDCGCIRIREKHDVIWHAAERLRNRGWLRIAISPTNLYADINITEAGRAIAG